MTETVSYEARARNGSSRRGWRSPPGLAPQARHRNEPLLHHSCAASYRIRARRALHQLRADRQSFESTVLGIQLNGRR